MSRYNRLLKTVIHHDLYTGKYVHDSRRSVEHVVPARLLNKKSRGDMMNLFMVDHCVNRFRSDYRFGGSVEEVLETIEEWEHMDNLVFRHRRHRLFFPLHGRSLVSKICKSMMEHHEYLQEYHDQIILRKDIHLWLHEKTDTIEKEIMHRKRYFNLYKLKD